MDMDMEFIVLYQLSQCSAAVYSLTVGRESSSLLSHFALTSFHSSTPVSERARAGIWIDEWPDGRVRATKNQAKKSSKIVTRRTQCYG